LGCAPDLTGRVERGAAAKACGALVVTSVRSRGGNIEVAADCCDCASGKEGVVGAAVFAFLSFSLSLCGTGQRIGAGRVIEVIRFWQKYSVSQFLWVFTSFYFFGL